MTLLLGGFAYVNAPVKDSASKKEVSECRMNLECVVIETPCGGKQAVNTRYQEEMQEKYDAWRGKIDCFWYDNRQVKAVYCLNHQCRVDVIQTEKSDPK